VVSPHWHAWPAALPATQPGPSAAPGPSVALGYQFLWRRPTLSRSAGISPPFGSPCASRQHHMDGTQTTAKDNRPDLVAQLKNESTKQSHASNLAVLEADRLGHGATERDQVIGRSRRSRSRGRDRQTNDRSAASCRKR
jgi:hypothetical protein